MGDANFWLWSSPVFGAQQELVPPAFSHGKISPLPEAPSEQLKGIGKQRGCQPHLFQGPNASLQVWKMRDLFSLFKKYEQKNETKVTHLFLPYQTLRCYGKDENFTLYS